jgi:hypothetical protein
MDALDELAARIREHINQNEPDERMRTLMHRLLDCELEWARREARERLLRVFSRVRSRPRLTIALGDNAEPTIAACVATSEPLRPAAD